MFYRFTKGGARVPVDLDGFYEGGSLFLVGGNPALKNMPLDLLRQDGVVTMGMNNVPCVFRPNLWISADKPQCFSPHIYASPEILKFTMISRRDEEVPGGVGLLRRCPSTFFFGTSESFTVRNFLDPNRDLVWWKSVFPMALQLAHRLGFKKVFLVGCGFHMNKPHGEQYAWETKLTGDQVAYSHKTYSDDVNRVKGLLPTFAKSGFELISCTPRSAIHSAGVLYLDLAKAVESVLAQQPRRVETSGLTHSSLLRGAS